MTGTEAYLALLRAALWGDRLAGIEPASIDGQVLTEIMRLAESQTTRGLVYDYLLRGGFPVPAETSAQMQRLLYQILNTHRKLNAAIERVVTALQQEGIPCILLKGQGVASYYPNPPLRECGDIDLYIGPERLEDAVHILTPLADKVDDQLHGKHWQLWIGGAEIELHLYSMVPETRRLTRYFRTIEADGLSSGLVPLNFSDVSVYTPADTFNAFYLFYHAWHHFAGSGIGFRHLCDWTRLLHVRRESIDRTRLLEMLKGMQLLGPWQLFGCIAVRDLGLPEGDFPFYDESSLSKSRRVLNLILSDGNFGRGARHARPRPKAYLAGKLFSLGEHFRRFLQVLSIAPVEAFRTLFIGGIRRVFQDFFHR
ncbi:MAG: nucleotidyltransferase family protein [Bacteroidales bacterium]|nr:nucleotidyltransferase family protein [Bacteroidales bacterium]